MDCSAGVSGIVEGPHDIRLIVMNGEVKLSYLRTPKPGTLLANVAQGGGFRVLAVKDLPAEAVRLAQEVDAIFSSYSPRLVAVDFMFQAGKPYVTEINTRPGFPKPSTFSPEYAIQYYTYLSQMFAEALKKS